MKINLRQGATIEIVADGEEALLVEEVAQAHQRRAVLGAVRVSNGGGG